MRVQRIYEGRGHRIVPNITTFIRALAELHQRRYVDQVVDPRTSTTGFVITDEGRDLVVEIP